MLDQEQFRSGTVAEDGSVRDPAVLHRLGQLTAVPQQGHPVLLPHGMGVDLDLRRPGSGEMGGQLARVVPEVGARTRGQDDAVLSCGVGEGGHHLRHRLEIAQHVDALLVPLETFGDEQGRVRPRVLLADRDGDEPADALVQRMISASGRRWACVRSDMVKRPVP
ncbi:hypothetical protein [Streptomyces sp. NPDC003036]|uniref:hypothetical protein n=1 Tax=Streptomyces sp. NPDC003036 TaxID=3154442 RepID=UPI0033B213A4